MQIGVETVVVESSGDVHPPETDSPTAETSKETESAMDTSEIVLDTTAEQTPGQALVVLDTTTEVRIFLFLK